MQSADKTPKAAPKGTSDKPPLRGIASLFDDFERKALFKKYLFFLGWVELLILVVCYLYRLGGGGYDSYGPVEQSFPWKAYFLISFLAPVAITFLIGTVIVGFNNYFGDPVPSGAEAAENGSEEKSHAMSDRAIKLQQWIKWLQRLPFLGLLLLLTAVVLFFYKMDTFLAFVANVGEQTVRVILMSAAVLLGVASVFALILVVLNYQLRKKSMAYQYRSEVADRFGLIILDDNTVINSEGKLLIQGKKWKSSVPLLPSQQGGSPEGEEEPTPLARPLDLKTDP